MSQTPTLDQLVEALGNAVVTLSGRPLTAAERKHYRSAKVQFTDVAKTLGVPLATLLSAFRFELCKATGNVAIPAGASGSAIPASRSLQ